MSIWVRTCDSNTLSVTQLLKKNIPPSPWSNCILSLLLPRWRWGELLFTLSLTNRDAECLVEIKSVNEVSSIFPAKESEFRSYHIIFISVTMKCVQTVFALFGSFVPFQWLKREWRCNTLWRGSVCHTNTTWGRCHFDGSVWDPGTRTETTACSPASKQSGVD